MPHFIKIFSLASKMVGEYQQQRPQDKLFFKYSYNKPNIIIEVVRPGFRESDFLVGFNTNDLHTAHIALKNFYRYAHDITGSGLQTWVEYGAQLSKEVQP